MLRGTLTKHFRVSLLITAALILGGDVGASFRDQYRAGDTKIIDMDLSNCYGITLTVHSDSSSVNATLYALSTAPKLDTRDEVKHTIARHKYSQSQGHYLFSYFYLYAGSNVSVSACTHDHKYHVSIIKGKDNYTLWQNGKEGPSVVEYTCDVDSQCTWYSGPNKWAGKIPAADDWYFTALSITADVNLYLQRYEYKVENSAILSSCIAGGIRPESCTVAKTPDVSTYLLVIGSGESKTIVEASTSCASDTGMYLNLIKTLVPVISLVGLIIGLSVMGICSYVTYKCREKRRRDAERIIIENFPLPQHAVPVDVND